MSADGKVVVWSRELSERYLDDNPLPLWFFWRGKSPHPSNRVPRYGKWLKETPYHRGLFAACHDVLLRAEPLPDAEKLARTLAERQPQNVKIVAETHSGAFGEENQFTTNPSCIAPASESASEQNFSSEPEQHEESSPFG